MNIDVFLSQSNYLDIEIFLWCNIEIQAKIRCNLYKASCGWLTRTEAVWFLPTNLNFKVKKLHQAWIIQISVLIYMLCDVLSIYLGNSLYSLFLTQLWTLFCFVINVYLSFRFSNHGRAPLQKYIDKKSLVSDFWPVRCYRIKALQMLKRLK